MCSECIYDARSGAAAFDKRNSDGIEFDWLPSVVLKAKKNPLCLGSTRALRRCKTS